MRKYLLLIVINIILLPCFVYADCTNEDIEFFNKKKSLIQFNYEYFKDDYSYNVYLYNPYPDIFTLNLEEYNCRQDDIYNFTCYNVYAGDKEIEVYGNTDSCKTKLGEITKTIYFNPYYLDDACIGIEDFILCSPTYEKDITYETFLERVEVYKKSLVDDEEKEILVEDEDSFIKSANKIFSNIKEFVMKNLTLIGIIFGSLLVLIILIILIIRNYKRRWRLE